MKDSISIDVDIVSNKRIHDEIDEKITRGIEDTIRSGRRGALPRDIIQAARSRIRQRGKIWTRELIRGFDQKDHKANDTWFLVVSNDSEHAAPVEYGADYGEEGPPLDALIPWVQSNLGDWTITSEFDGDGGGNAGGTAPDSDYTVMLSSAEKPTEVQTGADFGLPQTASSRSINIIDYEDGSREIFKELTDGPYSNNEDVLRNEAVFSRSSVVIGWQVGPQSDYVERRNSDGRLTEGAAQAWLFDSDSVDELYNMKTSQSDDKGSPADFLNEYRNDLARINVLDALVNNQDRHAQNMMIKDGELQAIDSGGVALNDAGTTIIEEHVLGFQSLIVDDVLQEYPEVDSEVRALLERQEELVDELVENSSSIIAQFEEIHGPDHYMTDRARGLLENNGEEFYDQLERVHETIRDRLDEGGYESSGDFNADDIGSANFDVDFDI